MPEELNVYGFYVYYVVQICNFGMLTLKRLGGGLKGPPPLDILRDYSATRKALAATLYDFFLSSFPHILTPNL